MGNSHNKHKKVCTAEPANTPSTIVDMPQYTEPPSCPVYDEPPRILTKDERDALWLAKFERIAQKWADYEWEKLVKIINDPGNPASIMEIILLNSRTAKEFVKKAGDLGYSCIFREVEVKYTHRSAREWEYPREWEWPGSCFNLDIPERQIKHIMPKRNFICIRVDIYLDVIYKVKRNAPPTSELITDAKPSAPGGL